MYEFPSSQARYRILATAATQVTVVANARSLICCAIREPPHHSFLKKILGGWFWLCVFVSLVYLAKVSVLFPYSTDPGDLCHLLEAILEFVGWMKMSYLKSNSIVCMKIIHCHSFLGS